MPAPKLTTIHPPQATLNLSWLKDLPEQVRGSVESLAVHLHETAGSVNAADIALLTQYGIVADEVRIADTLARQAAEAGEAEVWAKLSRRADQSRALLRGFLKDLRLNRASATGKQGTASTRKIAERSGSTWQGLI